MVATSKSEMNKATIDNYIKFHENPKKSTLTKQILLKYLNIHGVSMTWVAKKKKEEIIELLSSIDLQNPFRSTLKENISSSAAALSLTEVVHYLDFHQWNECPVQSLVTVDNKDSSDFGSMRKGEMGEGDLKRKCQWMSTDKLVNVSVSVSACGFIPPDSSSASATC